MERLTFEALSSKFDPSVRDRLKRLWDEPNTTALVLFECRDFWSSRFGQRSALAVGPGRTYVHWKACEGKWLNNLPSQRLHAVAYAEKVPVPCVEFTNEYGDLVCPSCGAHIITPGGYEVVEGLGVCTFCRADFYVPKRVAEEANRKAKERSYG
ncbi:MAG: hypothetical protein DRI61_15115 [Chloroflexi bacterium]|nr:MAG: hypothetical protein DRI61_15115 [Chloroflexota bacterium]